VKAGWLRTMGNSWEMLPSKKAFSCGLSKRRIREQDDLHQQLMVAIFPGRAMAVQLR
jgi:hypothetical protein